MQRWMKGLVVGSMMVMLSLPAMGSESIGIQYEGYELELSSNPIMRENHVMLPLRALSEEFGYSVNWNQELKRIQVSNGGKVITLYLNSQKADVDGKEVEMDMKPVVIQGVTYVPIRFVSENLGYSVTWDAKNRQVILEKADYNVYNGNYILDPKSKKLFYKVNKQKVEIGAVSLEKEGTPYLEVVKIADGGEIVKISNNYGEPARFNEVTTFFVKDGKAIGRVCYCANLTRVESLSFLDGLVGLCDGNKVYAYSNTSNQLVKEYDLTQLVGEGTYELEGLGKDFLLVREDAYEGGGMLILVDLTTNKVQALYELIPDAEDKDYAIWGALPTNDKIKFQSKTDGVLSFTYKTLEGDTKTLTYTLG